MQSHFRSARRRIGGIAVALVAAVGIGALVAPAAASAKPKNVKVMTRNIYLGADLTPALLAESPQEMFAAAGAIYDTSVFGTNFRGRAELLADEIARAKPDAIGLQEVALWRRGPLDSVTADPTPAREVVIDFLEVLQTQLAKRGLNYKVGKVQNEADLEVPIDRDADGTPEFDGRLTMRDAILVKGNLKVSKRRGGNYASLLPVPTPLGSISVTRGWTAVDLTKGKKRNAKKFRFVNTHLEAFSAFFRANQAQALRSLGLISNSGRLPVILVGDLNSDPVDDSEETLPNAPFPPTAQNAAYLTIEAAGFVDRGVTVNTCCHADDLLNPEPEFGSRIDHVLSKGRVTKLGASLTGADPELRTNTGLWPADHGGVVSRLRIR